MRLFLKQSNTIARIAPTSRRIPIAIPAFPAALIPPSVDELSVELVEELEEVSEATEAELPEVLVASFDTVLEVAFPEATAIAAVPGTEVDVYPIDGGRLEAEVAKVVFATDEDVDAATAIFGVVVLEVADVVSCVVAGVSSTPMVVYPAIASVKVGEAVVYTTS